VAGDPILDVDLLAFEQGSAAERRAVVDGVSRSLQTGFVYTSHDIPEEVLDEAYALLAEFFSLPPEVKARWDAGASHGQAGYTGLLVETAAGAEQADWKEMFNWGRDIDPGHPLRRLFELQYHDPRIPEPDVPGIGRVLEVLHERLLDLQRRFLRIVAVGLGAHEAFFDDLLVDGATLNRAIRYPPMSEAGEGYVWADGHADINLITALPRATAPGLQVEVEGEWKDVLPPEGHVIINTGMMLERLTNGLIPSGWHRVIAAPGYTGERYSVVQFCHPAPWMVLAPMASCVSAEHPQRYGGIRAGDLLERVLWDIKLIPRQRTP